MDEQRPDDQIIFGFPEEWADFRKRHSLFLDRFPNIAEATRIAFERVMPESEPIERFVMLYGRLCVEDFHEIMLCCGNGYGFAALKLLRALYEKAVTLEHLNNNPSELDAFLNHRYISEYKLFQAIADEFGPSALPENMREESAEKYEQFKRNYLVTDCKKCNTKRVNFTWSKLSFVAMAKRTRILGKLMGSAYYLPMRHTHSTGASLIERLEYNDEGFGFNPNAQRRQADSAVREAYTIILEVIYIQLQRFKIERLQGVFDKCCEDWTEIYVDDESRRMPAKG
jgi:hypothetical protein